MKIRRVVTQNDEEGKSKIKHDNELETIPGRPGLEKVLLWATKDLPVKLSEEDPAKWDIGTSIENGSLFRMTKYQPGVAKRWHSTDSVDYAIVFSGEIWLQLDKEEVHLKAGDVVVQRGTNHNWVNRSDKPCIMIYILIALEGGKLSTTGG